MLLLNVSFLDLEGADLALKTHEPVDFSHVRSRRELGPPLRQITFVLIRRAWYRLHIPVMCLLRGVLVRLGVARMLVF